MTVATHLLPITETFEPATQAELAEIVSRAFAEGVPLYPIGGGTSLTIGAASAPKGWGVSMSRLTRVVDYPARDMTITVEAGLTMQALAEVLAAEQQRLPIDAPNAELATLGGVVATATSGPRRFGQGTIRDYVIGVSGVDGRGVPFKAGGRVVKNVAGYDFCKLLTGSNGSLAIITQLTLKLRPLAEATALVACNVRDFDQAEALLAALVHSTVTPTAIELLAGPAWDEEPLSGGEPANRRAQLVVGLEGTSAEVDWMIAELAREWNPLGVSGQNVLTGEQATSAWRRLTEFPAEESGLLVKAGVLPSRVAQFVEAALQIAPGCSIESHAGSGVVYVRLPNFASHEGPVVLIRGLHPAAVKAGGAAIVLSCPVAHELTRPAIWGPARADAALMRAVKAQFDPKGLLNPGRAIFDN
ncbi:MAG TPA: FAD-binding oxidoreductase [Pirellulales bacterium]|jgi:glycolate oxidase FAD binding subunit